jgi:hypothetical protein
MGQEMEKRMDENGKRKREREEKQRQEAQQ